MDRILLTDKHEYLVNGERVPGVNEVLHTLGLIDLSSIPIFTLEPARQLGEYAHVATALDDKGTLDEGTLSKDLRPYLTAWRKFKEDFDLAFMPEEIEPKLYSPKWHFCGTPDRKPQLLRNKQILLDIKTSTTMYPATELQTAGYQILCEESYNIKIKERWGIQLLPIGSYKIYPYANFTDRDIFLGLVNAWWWKKEKGLIK